jgi:hypothetical protein
MLAGISAGQRWYCLRFIWKLWRNGFKSWI